MRRIGIIAPRALNVVASAAATRLQNRLALKLRSIASRAPALSACSAVRADVGTAAA